MVNFQKCFPSVAWILYPYIWEAELEFCYTGFMTLFQVKITFHTFLMCILCVLYNLRVLFIMSKSDIVLQRILRKKTENAMIYFLMYS